MLEDLPEAHLVATLVYLVAKLHLFKQSFAMNGHILGQVVEHVATGQMLFFNEAQ